MIQGVRFQPKDLSEFLSVSELAKVLSLNPKTIYRAVWSKTLPAYRLGRTWRISKRDLESFRKQFFLSTNVQKSPKRKEPK